MVSDALGRSVPLTRPPQRIVSLVPSLTEYLFVVGVGARVVGVTDYCIEPADAVARLPHVRGTKNPDRDHILALQPDLVLASKEENRRRDIDLLAAAGVSIYVTDICSVAGAYEQLAALAHLLEAEQSAASLLDEIHAALHHPEQVPPWRVLAFIWRDPWMAIGADTYANDLLRLCGADNLALRLQGRYPRATLEEFMQLDPDVILLPSEPYAFSEADKKAFAPFAQVTAVRAGQVHCCDGMLLTWYGPRTVEALRVFRQIGIGAAV
jgi:ABC-type Fe3+-hydroxamate transport system substrate-binding protein